MVLALTAPHIALAQDYIADVVQALQRSRVYVASGTEGTNRGTAANLQSLLKSDDDIVLVMLPASAERTLGIDTAAIATNLSGRLGNQAIIGLAVGSKVAGYAPALPTGVAEDMMGRAGSVANGNPVTALGTFAQNMHNWQRMNPKPKPPPPPKAQSQGGEVPWGAILPPGVIAVVAIATFVIRRRMTAVQESGERTHFLVPGQINDLLSKILRERRRISDRELCETLYKLCVDIERYFRTSSSDKKRDTLFFKKRLSDLLSVLTKYIDIQDSPRYYNDPEAGLRSGKEAILGFSLFVLDQIKLGNEIDLDVEYSVNTEILRSHRRFFIEHAETDRDASDRHMKGGHR